MCCVLSHPIVLHWHGGKACNNKTTGEHWESGGRHSYPVLPWVRSMQVVLTQHTGRHNERVCSSALAVRSRSPLRLNKSLPYFSPSERQTANPGISMQICVLSGRLRVGIRSGIVLRDQPVRRYLTGESGAGQTPDSCLVVQLLQGNPSTAQEVKHGMFVNSGKGHVCLLDLWFTLHSIRSHTCLLSFNSNYRIFGSTQTKKNDSDTLHNSLYLVPLTGAAFIYHTIMWKINSLKIV